MLGLPRGSTAAARPWGKRVRGASSSAPISSSSLLLQGPSARSRALSSPWRVAGTLAIGTLLLAYPS